MRRAFLDKAEKLEEARRPGSVTLLVLECRDFILSNPPIVAQAAYSAAQGFDLIPDAIVCVDTSAGDGGWLAYQIKWPWGWSEAARNWPSA